MRRGITVVPPHLHPLTDGPCLPRLCVARPQRRLGSERTTPIEAQKGPDATVEVDNLVIGVIPLIGGELSRRCIARCKHDGSAHSRKSVGPDAVRSRSRTATYTDNLQALEEPILCHRCIASKYLDRRS